MVELKGDASAINQVVSGLHVTNVSQTKIFCSCCVENVERVEFINASFVPERTCKMKVSPGTAWRTCSCCLAFVYSDAVKNATNVIQVRYCPNCGAKVVG